MQAKTSRLGQVVRFCIAGAASVSASYATIYSLTEYLEVWYIVSAVVGFVLNTGLNFILQKHWVFRDKEARMVGRQFVIYVAMTIFFLIGNTISLYLMVQTLHMWYVKAQIILTVIISILSFIISGQIFKSSQT